MLRASLMFFGLMIGGTAFAQATGPGVPSQQMGSAFPIAESSTLVNQFANQANDPKQTDVLFKEGNTIAQTLQGLKDKGFPIDFKEKQLPPTMTLLSLPKSTRIDEVLREILEPWNLSLYHSPLGHWVVRPDKSKKAKDDAGGDNRDG